MTLEQQQALAIASAKARIAAQATTPAGGPITPVPAPSKPFERAGDHGAFGAGMAEATIKGVMGVKQLFGGLSDDDKAVLDQIKLENDADPEGFKRGAGELAANVMTSLIPGGAASKTAKAAGLAKTLGRAALTAGGTEFVTGVGKGDTYEEQIKSKLENAGIAGLTGAATSGVLGGAAKAYKGLFRAAPETETLIKQGIVPTLQQGSDSKMGKFFGGLASGSTNVRNRQEQQIANAVLHKASEGNVDLPNATGREILDAAEGYVGGEYDKLFKGKRLTLSPSVVSEAQQAAQALNTRGQFVNEATDAGRAVANVMGETGDRVRRINATTLKDNYLTPLSQAAYNEANSATKQRILDARTVLLDKVRNAVLTPEQKLRLKDVDSRNFDVERIREAIKGKAGEEEGITLSRLATAYGKNKMAGNDTMDTLIGPALRVLGNTPRQDEARTTKQIIGRMIPPLAGAGGVTAATLGGTTGAVLGLPLAAAYGISALGQTEKGAKALLGQYDSQKALAEFLRKNANLIPSLGAGVGTYVAGE
jgi:hypothetical protein